MHLGSISDLMIGVQVIGGHLEWERLFNYPGIRVKLFKHEQMFDSFDIPYLSQNNIMESIPKIIGSYLTKTPTSVYEILLDGRPVGTTPTDHLKWILNVD